MLKAIIFDLDDTLLNWGTLKQDWFDYDRQHLRAVFEYVNRELAQPMQDFDGFVELYQALTVDVWRRAGQSLVAPHIGRVLQNTLVEMGAPLAQLDMDACLRIYNWQGLPGVKPFPEVLDVLEELRQHGIRLGIVTNAFQPMWMRDVELRTIGLPPEWFECRISAADTGYLKPHPTIYTRALDTLRAQPEEAVFVGDAPEEDVGGAQRAGMRGVLRVPPSGGLHVTNGVRPDATVDDLRDLLPALDGWFPGWR